MNNVGIVPVQDYVSNVASQSELDDLEQRIIKRRLELARRVPRPNPLGVDRELCQQIGS